jgi:hypothetical protein
MGKDLKINMKIVKEVEEREACPHAEGDDQRRRPAGPVGGRRPHVGNKEKD